MYTQALSCQSTVLTNNRMSINFANQQYAINCVNQLKDVSQAMLSIK